MFCVCWFWLSFWLKWWQYIAVFLFVMFCLKTESVDIVYVIFARQSELNLLFYLVYLLVEFWLYCINTCVYDGFCLFYCMINRAKGYDDGKWVCLVLNNFFSFEMMICLLQFRSLYTLQLLQLSKQLWVIFWCEIYLFILNTIMLIMANVTGAAIKCF